MACAVSLASGPASRGTILGQSTNTPSVTPWEREISGASGVGCDVTVTAGSAPEDPPEAPVDPADAGLDTTAGAPDAHETITPRPTNVRRFIP
jgi:hypothetical protein